MPGIQISTAVRIGPTNTTVRESSQAFFVGKAVRGPIDKALQVTSLEDFELKFGDFASGYFLHSTVETFFEEGGTQCYVARVEKTTSGTASVAATATVSNSLATPTTAITLTADGPGTWGNGATGGLSFTIEAGSVTDARALTLFLDSRVIMTTGSCLNTAQMVGRINTHPVASLLVDAVETNPSLSTNALTMPAINATPTNFTGGTIGNTAISDAQYVTALGFFLDSLGTGLVAIPEVPSVVTSGVFDAVTTGLIAHCNTNSRIAALHGEVGDSIATIRGVAQEAQSLENSEHIAVYYPWVSVPSGTVGVNRFIPPIGYVAGARSRAHNQVGPHQPGAGIISDGRFVNGVYVSVDKTNGDILDADSVNAIRIINNRVRIYGARSCSSDTGNYRYISSQDVVNFVVVQANRALEDVLFSPIDGRGGMFAAIEAHLVAVMEPLRALGALYEAFDVNGRRIDMGYTVKCNNSINPLSQLVNGTVTARVGLRVSSVGDSIQVDIVKSNLTTSVV